MVRLLCLTDREDMWGQQRVARPRGWITVSVPRIDLPKRRDERGAHALPDFTFAPSQCDLPHQTMQTDQRLPVEVCFAVDQCEAP